NTLLAGHCIGFNCAGLDVLGGVGGLVAHDINLLAQQVVHGGAGTLVGDGQQIDANGVGEHGAAQMTGGADACVGQGYLVFVGFQVCDQFFDIVGREVGAGNDGHGHVDHQADRLKAGVGVVARIFI